MCSAVQQTDPLGTRDPPPVNTTGTQLCTTHVEPVQLLTRARLIMMMLMYVSRIYLIGFKILSRVLVCVCACVCVCDVRRPGDGSPCSCREEEHRDQSANWEISTFTIYTYLQFTLFTIFPLPAQPSDAQSVRRAGRGCTVRQLQSAWGHRDKH